MSNFYTAPPIYNTGGWGQRGDHPTFDPTGLVTVKETGFYYETKLEVFNFKNNDRRLKAEIFPSSFTSAYDHGHNRRINFEVDPSFTSAYDYGHNRRIDFKVSPSLSNFRAFKKIAAKSSVGDFFNLANRNVYKSKLSPSLSDTFLIKPVNPYIHSTIQQGITAFRSPFLRAKSSLATSSTLFEHEFQRVFSSVDFSHPGGLTLFDARQMDQNSLIKNKLSFSSTIFENRKFFGITSVSFAHPGGVTLFDTRSMDSGPLSLNKPTIESIYNIKDKAQRFRVLNSPSLEGIFNFKSLKKRYRLVKSESNLEEIFNFENLKKRYRLGKSEAKLEGIFSFENLKKRYRLGKSESELTEIIKYERKFGKAKSSVAPTISSVKTPFNRVNFLLKPKLNYILDLNNKNKYTININKISNIKTLINRFNSAISLKNIFKIPKRRVFTDYRSDLSNITRLRSKEVEKNIFNPRGRQNVNFPTGLHFPKIRYQTVEPSYIKPTGAEYLPEGGIDRNNIGQLVYEGIEHGNLFYYEPDENAMRWEYFDFDVRSGIFNPCEFPETADRTLDPVQISSRSNKGDNPYWYLPDLLTVDSTIHTADGAPCQYIAQENSRFAEIFLEDGALLLPENYTQTGAIFTV